MWRRRGRRRGIWRVIKVPGRLGTWMVKGIKPVIGVVAIVLYVYIVTVQPFPLDVVPSVVPVGSSFLTLADLLTHSSALPVTSSASLTRLEGCGVVPGVYYDAVSRYVPGSDIKGGGDDGRFMSTVTEDQLPWHGMMPPDLLRAQRETGATRLVAAVRMILPRPLWGERHNVAQAAWSMAGVVLHPGDMFSLKEQLGPLTESNGYTDGPVYVAGEIVPVVGGGLCSVATALYNTVVYADLPVEQRAAHTVPVLYAAPGKDAAIDGESKDVRFTNDKETPVIFWSTLSDDTLYIALYGTYEPPTVTWRHEELNRTKTWVWRRPSPSLRLNEERVDIFGMDGVTVKTTVEVSYADGHAITRHVYVDTYAPLPETVAYGFSGNSGL